jgi:hypothetical protein
VDADATLTILKYGGILVGGISGILGAITKTHDQNRRLTGWGKASVTLTFVGLLVAAGAQYTEGVRKKRQDVASRKDAQELREENTKILEELREQKRINNRSEQEFREKFQIVLVQLNAAKHEDSKKITEEKIRVIQKDFSEWATNFVKNLPRIRSDLDKTKTESEQAQIQAKIDEVKKEVQISQQTFPVISFAVRYVQEAVRAFRKQTGKEIKVETWELPENFYEKASEYEIRFNTNVIWKLRIVGRRPAGQLPLMFSPSLRIEFTDARGKQSGDLWLRTDPTGKQFSMTYSAVVPTPDPKTISGNRDLADYEAPIREVFQRVIEAQLAQAVE